MLIKGGKYREVLSSVDTFMFDKAETLVEESFQVAKVRSMGAIPKSACSEIVACAEASSKHPLALSLRQAYGKKIDRSKIFEVSKVAGQEIRAKIAKSLVLVGTSKLMGAHKISYEVDAAPPTYVYIAIDGSYHRCILISDESKKDSACVLEQF